MSLKKIFLKIIIPILIIALGVVIMRFMISGRAEPVREVRKDPGVLVDVLGVKKEDIRIVVRGTGTVRASREVSISPQVSGRITYMAPGMVAGGFFREGEILFGIDETDYRLALRQAEAIRARAEYDLATIESRASIARAEWERLNKGGETPNPLVLFEPQLKNAKAALVSSSAIVEQARLNLERTKIKAPFNCRVRSEDIDPGQYLKSGSNVAVTAGTDNAEIIIPLPMNELYWIEIPRIGTGDKGSPAIVSLNVGGSAYDWKGRIARSTGEVDTKSRMMQIVVEVNDPYGLKEKKDNSRPDLATGAFVDVSIKGKILKDVFIIPRTAVRDNSTVWVMDSENKLRIRKVVPIRTEREKLIIRKGLDEGDMLVLTNISGAADGMKLRTIK